MLNDLSERTSSNTALVMSSSLYDSLSYIRSRVPTVKLAYTPCSLYHRNFLKLLQSFDVEFNCPNKDVLLSLKELDGVRPFTIDSDVLTASFIQAASERVFTVRSANEIARIEAALGPNTQFTWLVDDEDQASPDTGTIPDTSVLITGVKFRADLSNLGGVRERVLGVVQQSRDEGHVITSVNIGEIKRNTDFNELEEVINDLTNLIGPEVVFSVDVSHDILSPNVMLATKVLDRTDCELTDGHYTYHVDISRFGELAPCQDDSSISVVNLTSDSTSGLVLGNFFGEEDVIFAGAVPATPVDGWIILNNIGDADLTDCDVILLDSDMRIIQIDSPVRPVDNEWSETSYTTDIRVIV